MVLPDLVAHDLDILFCGTAAGAVSAQRRAYYAGPGNAFWPTLFAVGLVPVRCGPRDYPRLAQWNMGLTDLAKHVFGSDGSLRSAHFDSRRLSGLIAAYQPRIVAFTGKRAAAQYLGSAVTYGLVARSASGSGTRLFVLPSPSGAARRHWNIDYWRELARLRAGLR